jgi:hypothetical protein
MTIVCDLAMQHLVVSPDPESPAAAAVPDDVGRKLMRGDDEVVGPAARQACLAGVRGNRGPKLIQRIAVQWLVKNDLGAMT